MEPQDGSKMPAPSGPRSEMVEREPTVAYTSEQSLWRAATVEAEYVEPLGAIASPGDDLGALGEPGRRYQIQEVLGVGGMGEVRLCRDEAIGRDVALKTLLRAQDAGARAQQRFLREVRVQGQLEHPSVVPVYDVGVGDGGCLFFTMRRVRGHTLAEVIEGLAHGDAQAAAAHTRRRLLDAFVRVCLAVHYAHTRGVLHRDLKPSNVMLGEFGEVYVLDWGIARLVAEHATGGPVPVARSTPPPDERMAGTPGYMSPEQLSGRGDRQDARTDVYSLGAILYEILALRPLHTGARAAIDASTLGGADARASRIGDDVPPELDAICVRATSVDPAERFAGARQLADAVERYLDGDRDVERRRELAGHHLEAAKAAVERSQRLEDAAGAEAARAEAMRAVIHALALDPERAEAKTLLVQLLIKVPEVLPPAVESEMAENARRTRHHTARFGVYSLVAWAATIPFVASLGVREWTSFGAASILTTLSALYAVWIWRRNDAGPRQRLLLATLVAATCGALGCWLGPFVLVPTAAATTTLWFALHAERRERRILMVLGGLGVLVPFLLELAGWVPPSFRFEAGRLVLLPRALALPPLGTTLALAYSSVTFCILQPVLLGGLRDAMSSAERKLFLQAWHLRQLAPDVAKVEGH